QLFTFDKGTTAAQMATALNQASEATGVLATAIGDQLLFNSIGYGSAATASVQVVSEGTGGTFGSSLSGTNATGTDIQATVNGVSAIGQGNTVSLNTPSLAFSADLDPTQVTPGLNVDFNVTGGGALFQLGPQVTSAQQVNLGIQSVTTSSLGGTVGRLYEIGSGNDASLTADPTKAGQILQAALNSVTSLRGQLGAFQTATIDTNVSTLTDAVTNLTAAQSDIQDADFAAESANLSREQILVQSGTTVAGIASSTPANVLSLLQKAAQV
ncbi:MAG: flagellin, partial [Thermoguttaceae bacterium]